MTTIQIIFLFIFMTVKLASTHHDWQKYELKTRQKSNETENTPIEYFHIQQREFVMIFKPVLWYEAKTLCKHYGYEFALPYSEEELRNVGVYLHNSKIHSSHWWLGGQQSIDNLWIVDDDSKDTNYLTKFINSHLLNPDDNDFSCLGIEVHLMNSYFKTLSCQEKLPFVCEKRASRVDESSRKALTKIENDRGYLHLYLDRVNWIEAFAACRERNMELAVVDNNKLLQLLGKTLSETGQNLEWAWLGGVVYDDKWIWLKINEEVNYAEFHYKLLKSPQNISEKLCLAIVINHTIENYQSVLKPFDCTKLRPYFCQKNLRLTKYPEMKNSFKCKDMEIPTTVYLFKKTWAKAQIFCSKHRGILAEPSWNTTLKKLAICLGDHNFAPINVWLGGRYVRQRWIWDDSLEEIINANSPLPWIESEFDSKYSCLNLDRVKHDTPEIYGIKCNQKQPFICTGTGQNLIADVPNIMPVKECYHPTIPVYLSKYYFVLLKSRNWRNAIEECRDYGSEIALIDYENNMNSTKTIVETVSSSFECPEGSNHCESNISQIYCSKKLEFWLRFEETSECSTIDRKFDIQDVKCNELNSIICQTTCKPHDIRIASGTVKCKKMSHGNELLCSVKCDPGFTLLGVSELKCNKMSGWTSVPSNHSFKKPQCIPKNLLPATIVNIVFEQGPQMIYFPLYDNMKMNEYKVVLQFILSLLSAYPLTGPHYTSLMVDQFDGNQTFQYYYTVSTCKMVEEIRSGKFQSANQLDRPTMIRYLDMKKSLIILFLKNLDDSSFKKLSYLKRHNETAILTLSFETNKTEYLHFSTIDDHDRFLFLNFTSLNNITDLAFDLLRLKKIFLQCPVSKFVFEDLPAPEEYVIRPSSSTSLIKYDSNLLAVLGNYNYTLAKSVCLDKYRGQQINKLDEKLITIISALNFNTVWNRTEENKCFWTNIEKSRGSTNTIENIYVLTEEMDCNKLSHFLCDISECSFPKESKMDQLQYVCKTRNDKMTCNFSCKEKYLMLGSTSLSCLSKLNESKLNETKGWLNLRKINAPFPDCHEINYYANKWVQLFYKNQKLGGASMIFLIDQSDSESGFKIQMEFISVFISLYPPQKYFPYGVEILTGHTSNSIPLETDPCEMSYKITNIEWQPPNGSVNLKKAFMAAFKNIRYKYFNGFSTIVLISDRKINISLVKESRIFLRNFNCDLKVIKIREFKGDQAETFTSQDVLQRFQLLTFKSYTDFKLFIEGIRATSTPMNCRFDETWDRPLSLDDIRNLKKRKDDIEYFEKNGNHYVVYPKRVTFSRSLEICEETGGSLYNFEKSHDLDHIRDREYFWTSKVSSKICKLVKTKSKGPPESLITGCLLPQKFICQYNLIKEINCNPKALMKQDLNANMQCHTKKFCDIGCDPDEFLIAPHTFLCTPKGWKNFEVDFKMGKRVCLDINKYGMKIWKKISQLVTDNSGFIFLLEDAKKISRSDIFYQISFASLIVHGFTRLQSRKMGLIISGMPKIPFQEMTECDFLQRLDLISGKSKIDFNVIEDSFLEALVQLKNDQKRDIIIFLISTRSTINSIARYESYLNDIIGNNYKLVLFTIGSDSLITEELHTSTQFENSFHQHLKSFKDLSYVLGIISQLEEMSLHVQCFGERHYIFRKPRFI